MDALTRMLVALIAIMAMFVANIVIIYARKKTKQYVRIPLSIFAYALLVLSFVFIFLVLFTY